MARYIYVEHHSKNPNFARQMNGRNKIFNDPVYGFVSVPGGLLLGLIDHPYFQRLRRIRQQIIVTGKQ